MKKARIRNKLKKDYDESYRKKSKIKGVQEIGGDKSYIPDGKLVNFIQEWLQIHKKRDTLTLEGKNISNSEKEHIRTLDVTKVRIIDEIIFPAMANLTYFFEAMAASSRMSMAFEDELIEMLDPRNSKEAALCNSGNRFSSVQFRQNNFARLIIAMLSIPTKKNPGKELDNDFRIGLMYQTFNVIGDNMDRLLYNEYPGNQIGKSFLEDYRRMQGWFLLLTRSVKKEPNEYDRKIGFSPIWLSPNDAISDMDF